MIAHEIEYEIKGNEMQFVEITLDPREAVIAEAGAMMMMDSSIKMDTVFGDGSKKSGGFWGVLGGAAKRVITGESLFMTSFSNTGYIKQKVAFAAPYPGKIIPIDLKNYGGRIICQKDAYLCSAMGVNIGIVFTKKLGVGFFGGEGFILQKLEGDGMAFINAGGTIVKRSLMPGETIKIDTGCLVAMTQNVHYDIEFVGGIKNTLFGGEGMFFATLTGPGDVWIQSLPFSKLASRVISAAPQTGGRQVDQGSILGSLGDIFER